MIKIRSMKQGLFWHAFRKNKNQNRDTGILKFLIQMEQLWMIGREESGGGKYEYLFFWEQKRSMGDDENIEKLKLWRDI